jgi:transcriptional regulator with GAF, ATPase, and Fis domain
VVTLAQQVIQQLCRYLDVPLGAIFIREGSQFYLRGRYAYPATQQQRSFTFGEGLAGEVASRQQALLVENVPPGYLYLATGIGELEPTQLFLHPLVYEENVIGVVELATLKQWTPRQSGFLNSVAESIAIAFHTAQTRGRIDELLMETQQQAEELQAQEEELRAANEEWEVQSESLRSMAVQWHQEKARLEATIAELRKQNALLSR